MSDGLLSGLLSGFNDQLGSMIERTRKEKHDKVERDRQTLMLLAQHGGPEMKADALAGLAELAQNPGKGGIAAKILSKGAHPNREKGMQFLQEIGAGGQVTPGQNGQPGTPGALKEMPPDISAPPPGPPGPPGPPDAGMGMGMAPPEMPPAPGAGAGMAGLAPSGPPGALPETSPTTGGAGGPGGGPAPMGPPPPPGPPGPPPEAAAPPMPPPGGPAAAGAPPSPAPPMAGAPQPGQGKAVEFLQHEMEGIDKQLEAYTSRGLQPPQDVLAHRQDVIGKIAAVMQGQEKGLIDPTEQARMQLQEGLADRRERGKIDQEDRRERERASRDDARESERDRREAGRNARSSSDADRREHQQSEKARLSGKRTAESRKQEALAKAERDFRKMPGSPGKTVNTPEDLEGEKARIQSAYEQELEAAGNTIDEKKPPKAPTTATAKTLGKPPGPPVDNTEHDRASSLVMKAKSGRQLSPDEVAWLKGYRQRAFVGR